MIAPSDFNSTSELDATLVFRVAYDGSSYSGFAEQPGQTTVAGELRRAIETLLRLWSLPVPEHRSRRLPPPLWRYPFLPSWHLLLLPHQEGSDLHCFLYGLESPISQQEYHPYGKVRILQLFHLHRFQNNMFPFLTLSYSSSSGFSLFFARFACTRLYRASAALYPIFFCL